MQKPRLEETKQGLTVFFTRYLYSQYSPSTRPKNLAQLAPIEKNSLYIVPSPLLGYGLVDLLNRITDDSFILAIEVSQELFHLCTPHLEESLKNHPRLKIVRLDNTASLQRVLEELGLWRFRRVRCVELNAGIHIFPKIYEEMTTFTMKVLSDYWKNRHSLGVLGRFWIRHFYANLACIHPASIEWNSKKPIVVVGAGPSLDTLTDFLKQFENHLEIWAIDTALASLIDQGIKPDVVCVLETQAWNHLDFHGIDGREITVLADISSYPHSLTLKGLRTCLFSSEFAKLQFFKRLKEFGVNLEHVPPLGSVGLTAVYLALSHSQGPIFLSGLDFAYTPGKSHARGTSMHKWQLTHITRTNPVPGWTASMQRPRLKAKGYTKNELDTDAVLAGYAHMFRSHFGNSTRLFALSGGLDIGVPLIEQEEAIRLIHEQENATSKEGELRRFTMDYSPSTVQKFLQEELQAFDRVIECWEDYVHEKSDAHALVQALDGLDQVYCDFPDSPPLPKKDNSFLVRAVKRCRELRSYIHRVNT